MTDRDMSKDYPAETEAAADDDSDDVNYDPVPYDQVRSRQYGPHGVMVFCVLKPFYYLA